MHVRIYCLFAVLSACISSRVLTAEELTPKRFQELHAELQQGDEPWRTIPWKIDVLDAQRSAAKQKKPIFVWAMDGHPLGCT